MGRHRFCRLGRRSSPPRTGDATGFTSPGQQSPLAIPVILGTIALSGRKHFDRSRRIDVADIPVGLDSRQLFWIDDQLAEAASVEIPRSTAELAAEMGHRR